RARVRATPSRARSGPPSPTSWASAGRSPEDGRAEAARAEALAELASVYWRPRVDEQALRRRGRLWTSITVAHVVPFVAVAILIFVLQPLAVAVSLIALAKAWLIPALYAQRGANVARPKRRVEEEP